MFIEPKINIIDKEIRLSKQAIYTSVQSSLSVAVMTFSDIGSDCRITRILCGPILLNITGNRNNPCQTPNKIIK